MQNVGTEVSVFEIAVTSSVRVAIRREGPFSSRRLKGVERIRQNNFTRRSNVTSVEIRTTRISETRRMAGTSRHRQKKATTKLTGELSGSFSDPLIKASRPADARPPTAPEMMAKAAILLKDRIPLEY